MGSYNLQITIADTSASVILAVLITYLTVYLHIALTHEIRVLSIPISILIISLSASFGAVQVVVHPYSCSCHKLQENHVYEHDEEEDEDETDEVEDVPETVDEGNEETEESPASQDDGNSVSANVTDSRSIDQLRAFAAKINEMNLKRASHYEGETPILNPEEVFEPRPELVQAESTS